MNQLYQDNQRSASFLKKYGRHVPYAIHTYGRGTYIQDEFMAYPNGGQTRACRAIFPDGVARRVWAGIPDTMATIPAHGRVGKTYVRGHILLEEGAENEAYEHFVKFVLAPDQTIWCSYCGNVRADSHGYIDGKEAACPAVAAFPDQLKQSERFLVRTYETDGGAWLAGARISANGGPTLMLVRENEANKFDLFVYTESDLNKAREVLALFDDEQS